MSIMRTYFVWQIAISPDKSYLFGPFGLCSDAEFSVGIIIGCFPVMPKFFQHVCPKLKQAFSWQSTAASNLCSPTPNHQKNSSNTKLSKNHVLSKIIKNPFAKYKMGLSTFESCIEQSSTQLGSEHYTLHSESTASHSQAEMVLALIKVPSVTLATKRDDLESGFQTDSLSRVTS